jgi:formylglycine-generating enzyme required for sulfatase activity
MPKKSAHDPRSDEQTANVKLKPILGVQPGVYLTVLLGLVLALMVFFFLFYPGLRNPGAYVTVDVEPGNASIIVDGTFAGTAPGTIFVRNGNRKIEVKRGFYSIGSRAIDIKGRIFATLIFPSRLSLAFELSVSDLDGLISASLDDFSRNPHIPQIVSDASWAAYGVRNDVTAADDRRRLYDFLETCMPFITSENQLMEMVKAAGRVASFGTFLSPTGFLSLVREGIRIKEKHDTSPAWLLFSLSSAHAASLGATPWVISHIAQYRESLSQYFQANLGTAALSGAAGGGLVRLGGIAFRSVPQGILVMGKDDNLESLGKNRDALLAHPVSVASFLLAETETTNREFETFVRDVPEWKPSNRDALVHRGAVTDTYLSDWQSDAPPAGKEDSPVSSVSYDAARAYCAWLTTRIQGALPGSIARLPTEAEWEWAARGQLRGMPYPLGEKPGNAVFFQTGITGPSRAGMSEPNGYGLRDMMGNLWEWCADGYGPSAYLLASLDPLKSVRLSGVQFDTYEKVVRGGGWANQKELVKVYTRGSQPRDWCTPYLGFRVAVSRS